MDKLKPVVSIWSSSKYPTLINLHYLFVDLSRSPSFIVPLSPVAYEKVSSKSFACFEK